MDESIVAIIGVVLAALFGGGGVASVIVALKSAKKSDLDGLRVIIDVQRERIDELETEVKELREENTSLRRLLSEHGIDPDSKRQKGLLVR